MPYRVTKAVIPVAGLGTRMLPFTKTVPKELLPIVNKPLIQYAVEEAIASGIEEIILVASPGKSAIQDYLRRDESMERELERRGRIVEAKLLRAAGCQARLSVVYQEQPLGLGHAVYCARRAVGESPFALILPDALILGPTPCLRQLLEGREAVGGSCIATREVPAQDRGRYGMLDVESVADTEWADRLFRVRGLVEKPSAGSTKFRFGVFGRYVLEPAVFECIERVAPDSTQEIQITGALSLLCSQCPLYACRFQGDHFDVGNRLGYLQASVQAGLDDPGLSAEFQRFLRSRLSDCEDSGALRECAAKR